MLILGIILAAGTFAILSMGLPDVTSLESLTAAQSTQIYDRNGQLLYTVHGEENRAEVPYGEISPYVINSTIAIEDDTFWQHGGFDLLAITKAGMYEVFGIGSPRGGSTITQQYVKNTFLSAERSYIRKAKELILSIRLERAYDKKKILELYLNRIPYGNNAYGVAKGAEIYFNKKAKDLTLAESSVLASLPQAPTKYNPYGNNKYSHLLKQFTDQELFYRKIKSESDLQKDEYVRGLIGQHVNLGDGDKIYIQGRTDLVLKRMFELGTINAEERKKALDDLQKLQFNNYVEKIRYPHFVLYIKQILEDKYGKDIVERGGLKVYTTIDPSLQDVAEKTAKDFGEANEKKVKANNVAILTISAKTGQILAMVGSRDYYNEAIDGNVNVVLRPRQPGSSFKPIVYSQAFYNGYGPGSVTYDIPTKLGNDKPQDFDGKWRGQITLREALGQSRNIPAIQAYFLAGQQDPIIDLATKMGVTSLKKSHSYGYPLAIGAGEVPMIDMVTAYGTFANNGKKPELTGILKVVNSSGDILEEWKQKEFEEVLDPQIAYLINSILSDQKYAIGKRLFIEGKINAAKTGTSTKETKSKAEGKKVMPMDGWTIGYTPTIVTGVWIGNTDGSEMSYSADGYDTAAPIFNIVMGQALKNLPPEPFIEPPGVQHIKVSKASGKLPGPDTPGSMVVEEIFTSFSAPTETEHLFYKAKIDKISGLLATEFTPPDSTVEAIYQNYEPIADMLNWAQEIKDYYKNTGGTGEGGDLLSSQENGGFRIGMPPTEYDNIHTAETAKNVPSISILNPASQSIVPHGNVSIEVSVSAPNGVATVEFYLDDKKSFFTTTAPYSGKVNLTKFLKSDSKHLIVAKVIDSLGYGNQSAVEIKIANDGMEIKPAPSSKPIQPANPTTPATTAIPPSNQPPKKP